jgi:hypothetical protein
MAKTRGQLNRVRTVNALDESTSGGSVAIRWIYCKNAPLNLFNRIPGMGQSLEQLIEREEVAM